MQERRVSSLEKVRWVHIIGVGGTLMGAFAAYLKRQGLRVTGSDSTLYPPMSHLLVEAGVELFTGYRPGNLVGNSPENRGAEKSKPDLVVIGNVIRADNLEAKAAMDGGYPYSSLPEAMEELFLQQTHNIVVAGTHGKTTTSSLLTHVLRECGQIPNYFIGGVAHDLPHSFEIHSVDPHHLFVLEGDEYDTAFWDKVPKFNYYRPKDVLLTSIEYDHADIYPDLESVVQAFQGLLQRLPPQGRLIACFEYPQIRECVQGRSVISYGHSMDAGARYRIENLKITAHETQFDVVDAEQGFQDQITLQLPGLHNALNALAVWLECRELGLNLDQVRAGLRSFRGVKRRQEFRGEVQGVRVMDDFAHHPTAVRETLAALRAQFTGSRLVVLFEPRSATSRRKIFQNEYAKAFEAADVVWIAHPYDQTRIRAEERFSSQELVVQLQEKGKKAFLLDEGEKGALQVVANVHRGDLCVVLSNGGFEGMVERLLRLLGTVNVSVNSEG